MIFVFETYCLCLYWSLWLVVATTSYIELIQENSIEFLLQSNLSYYYISNSEICPRHVWLQYDIKSLWLFGLICAQNSVSGLVLYNRLNFIKSPWLFCSVWVKIHSYIHLCPLPNYFLQTMQIYLDIMQSFPLSKSELLCSVSLMKYLLGDLF